MKRDKYDDLFSKIVRARAGWKCERCGKAFPGGPARRGLHCSHVFGRRRHSVRWSLDPPNAFSHCYGCHQYLASNPDEFKAWAAEQLGSDTYSRLVLKANTTKKWTAAEKEQMYADMKAEWAEIVKQGRD